MMNVAVWSSVVSTCASSFFRPSDGMGALNSALCIVHCLAMPVLVAVGAWDMEHPGVTWAFIMLALLAVRSAVHGLAGALTAGELGIGWTLFVVGPALETMDERFEPLAYAGSGILIPGHIRNRYAPAPENINQTPASP